MPSACAVSWTRIRSCALGGASALTTIRWLGRRTSRRRRRALLERDGVAERARERGGGLEQVRVAVAGERLAGRLERGGLAAVERVDLAAVEDRHGAEEHPLLLVGSSAEGRRRGGGRHRREDPDRALALADAVAELEPGLEAGDEARVGLACRIRHRLETE